MTWLLATLALIFFNENIKKMLRGVELYLLIFDIIYETKIAI